MMGRALFWGQVSEHNLHTSLLALNTNMDFRDTAQVPRSTDQGITM